MIINSDFLNGLTVEQAKSKIIKEIEKTKNWRKKITYRIKRLGEFLDKDIGGAPYQ